MHVSVVIPLYNARDVIGETIETVLAQLWRDHDIVVVDDGSTDGSGEIARAFGCPVRYIRQENRGVAAARNRGVAESQGDCVALLDHDDLWNPAKMAKQVSVLEARPEVGMAITDVVHTDREGRPLGIVGHGYARVRADAIGGPNSSVGPGRRWRLRRGVRCGRDGRLRAVDPDRGAL